MAPWKYRIGLVCFSLICLNIASPCSWSNEGCTQDTDCCSHSCHRAHEGTNPRCRHSTLGERCVFNYHCQDTLTCGPHYNCCSPYWKICMKDSDCCDEEHVCRLVEGFYYKRCLFPSGLATPRAPCSTHLIMTSIVLGHWMAQSIASSWNI
ncbi:hypothetical protein BgiMline_025974 [Biomphalaria glabrata]|uniref:Uncharacterized protein LOC106054865 isoform X2 n=1 Tax=Biomphalaria glabrata TaxID=6526 RepID=A0A9U8DYN7_BIOGL|nr:uncharacterized protein LOC106054865 isoform X2 [Biomphalaria glabrata]XP_013066390.2 uncharacterized protein LOC106054865 isoform X2 [Biomphalaria glabrata]XP_013066391.2 uncharacterized protein LOC106054865 isoform X2 [Biomphalaria glabrata]XP_013066392.2 uncharacterized protein LOC106054865 isoform X2 [Biomphalaria glabrata]KAI8730269.1 hypothetical protein BgiMline_031198 [Biomphalaria glabrata]KAI8778469.1 hypothetical protein BgiBS90_021119 [Biomphalaria glabrata]